MKKGLSKSDLNRMRETFARLHQEQQAVEATAPEVVAAKVTYADDAPKQPDGTFEVLFLTRDKADQFVASYDRSHKVEIVSFAEGVALAARDDCSGGLHSLNVAKRFQRINPFVQSLDLKIG